MSKPEELQTLAEIIQFPPRLASPEELARHEREIREAEALEARRLRREARDRVEATIPEVYAGARLDAPWLHALVGARAMAQAREALSAPLVVFFGPPGAGKTTLAVAMMRARGEDGSRFVSAKRLGTARIQHPAGAGEAPYVETAMRAKLALIDEVGAESLTQNDALPDVIFERHAHVLPTWYTTGLEPKAIGERFGGGAERRILEGAVVIRLKGPRR